MFVIEGCDVTGKTTLVNTLCAELRINTGARFTPDRDKIWESTRQDTYLALSQAVMGSSRPVIWDRLGLFSDPIYARITQRQEGPAFKQDELQYCLAVIKALRCPVIVCWVPLDVALENAEASHQMEGVRDNFAHIHGQYEGLLEYLTTILPNIHKYDYRVEGSYKRLVEDVIKPYLRRREVREWH